ncbi:unnamed protein product [Cladocopium goreaui]|uniref:PDZ domain-containing protein n=1 Tax=Cladocopium goreaui TaxID=2562237 RepID=A0A9P1D6V5_9DINO|nr:unnamed protein product [Cladocopium goreaui]|mmetsp:Transcript_16854/g.37287  ORF Transcript_16854/g.37287 Transcript_16854/m.37287 type:complete len:211 (-) Transcript_16854:47-679(-)
MFCCCATETEDKQLDVGASRPPIVEVQKTFANEDEGPIFTASLSRGGERLLGISVDRSDTNCVVVRDVTGGAAGSWNTQMPHKQIRTFDQVLEVNGDTVNGDDIARKLENESQEIVIKFRRPEERKVILEKPGRLGIDVNYRKTSVKPWVASISPGLVADWNKENPDLAVLPHDRIVAVNDVSGNIDMILEKLRSPDKRLVLTCMHYEVM